MKYYPPVNKLAGWNKKTVILRFFRIVKWKEVITCI
jgi:hypothetical protein